MAEILTCPICGEPTRVYMGNARKDRLCGKHADEFKAGKIEQCPDCGKWHNTKELCECKKPKTIVPEEIKKVIVINEENKSRCITCGAKTDGLLFCKTCYRKFKDKKLLFEITNCSNVELLDEDYEGKYVCKDGHVVKSKSEREIDNYLFEHNIPHAYEKALNYGETENEILHPDFFLKNYLGEGKHVYIEHWGYNENNFQYTKTKKYKMDIYKKAKVTLICTHEKVDTKDMEATLDRKLNKHYIKENEINFDI